MTRTKLRIVYVIARFHPFKGGAEENCLQLARLAVAAGHEVTVLTTDASPAAGKKLPPTENYLGINIIRTHRWNQQLNLGFYPGLLPKLLKLKADVIHVENGPGFIWAEWCLILKKLISSRTKFIATPHGSFLATPDTHTGLKRLVARLAKVVGRFYFRIIWSLLFDVVIQIAPTQQAWLTKDYGIKPSRIKLIPNGISKSMLLNGNRMPQKPTSPVVITFTGRMEKYKGVQNLIHAAARLKQMQLSARFKMIIMGRPGPIFPELEKLVETEGLESEVEFIPSPSNEVRDRILTQQSQIHVLPSQREGTGIVLIEAMAKGNAIVTTTGNEAANMLIDQGVNGYIYDFEDIEKLTAILKVLIENQNLRTQMIKLNLEKVQHFTWEVIYPDYQSLLVKLVVPQDTDKDTQSN